MQIVYHVFSNLHVVGPDLHLETEPVEGSVDKAQVLGIRLGLRIMKII
jgi:hypothetical protein